MDMNGVNGIIAKYCHKIEKVAYICGRIYEVYDE